MSLSYSILGNLIDTNLNSFGANGSNRTILSNAIAKGIIESIVGKSFTTADTGQVSGSGIGVGIGITGLTASNMTTTAISLLPSTGINANNLMNAIMTAVVDHLNSSATLNSTHSPVFSGTGIIVVGSIDVSASEMSSNIDNELSVVGANGSNRTVLCNAIATGIVTEILSSGSGNVTITGSGSNPSSSGTGAGTGVIS